MARTPPRRVPAATTRSPLRGRRRSTLLGRSGNSVLVYGGRSIETFPSFTRSTLECDGALFDTVAESWSLLSPCPDPEPSPRAIAGHALVLWCVSEGLEIDTRGYMLDLTSDTWTPMSAAPLAGRIGPATAPSTDALFLWGGVPHRGSYFDDGAIFHPATNRWDVLPPSPLAPRGWAAVTSWNDQFFVWGGTGGYEVGPFKDGAVYCAGERSWREITPAPLVARRSAEAVWTGTEVVVLCGEHPDERLHKDVAAYDPATDTWRKLPPMPRGFSDPSVATSAGLVIVADDGYGRHGFHFAVLDLEREEWRTYSFANLSEGLATDVVVVGERCHFHWFAYEEDDEAPDLLSVELADLGAAPTEAAPAAKATIAHHPDLLDHMIGSPGACWIEIRGVRRDEALRAAEHLRGELFRLPHPEEPDEPAPSFVSAPEPTAGGASFWFDMADCEELMPDVLEVAERVLRELGLQHAYLTSPQLER